jgi:mRNA-degrading endonuclease RelE of RelBE toxin-antitoxin system
MEKYKVLIRKSAADELGRIPKKDLLRIVEIFKIETQYIPHGLRSPALDDAAWPAI